MRYGLPTPWNQGFVVGYGCHQTFNLNTYSCMDIITSYTKCNLEPTLQNPNTHHCNKQFLDFAQGKIHS